MAQTWDDALRAGGYRVTPQRQLVLEAVASLSEDKDYVETDKKKNILRWDVVVPAGATGLNAFSVEYKFKLEFDKQMMLAEGK